tara:strand:+ start:480 stop:1316 length:837 start_codon:yes stop_codon:yes gene_type:complete
MSELVTTNWLQKNINKKNLVIFDCSWYMKDQKRNPLEEYKKEHIIGSHFFNIERISNNNSSLPHMIPNIKFFKNNMKNFDIQKNSIIVNYGREDLLGPSRVWWMFKYFGFNNVKVLNSNLINWKKEKKLITNNKSKLKKSNFKFKINRTLLSKANNILENLDDKKQLIIDARNPDRFNGKINEPRKGLRSGHIPNSKNIFWKNLIDNKGQLKNAKIIKKLLLSKRLNNKKVIFSCGSGISACVLSLSLKHVLDINSSVYDGSWAQWGKNKKLPIVKNV